MRITSPWAPAAAAFRRPTTPGTGRPSLQVAWARFMMYTWLVTSSQVFRGPTPIMENNSRPSLRLATALPETAAGMGGSFFCVRAEHGRGTKYQDDKKRGFLHCRDITPPRRI